MKLLFPSEKYSEGFPCMQQGHPHLYLLRVYDVDGQVEGPQHHIAIAIMWCTLGRGGGVAAAASTL